MVERYTKLVRATKYAARLLLAMMIGLDLGVLDFKVIATSEGT